MKTDNNSDISRRSVLRFAGAAGAVGIAGCTSDGSPEESGMTEESTSEETGSADENQALEVHVTMGQMDSGLDPQDHAETNTNIIVGQAYEGLLDRDKQGGIIAGLAKNWERTADGSIRFELREAKFHSGDRMTAEDAAYSIRRIVSEDVGISSPQANDFGLVDEVTAGDGTVTVSFEGFNPIAFQLFATNGDIVQQSWIEENSSDFINQNANGTGPFRVTGYDSGNEVVYESNTDYWGGDVPVDSLTMAASSESSTRVNRLLAGETDIVTNVPPQEVSRVEGSDVARIRSVPSARIIFLQMRYDVEPFSSQQFRQALNYAVDVESILENVLNGFGSITGQPTLSGHVGYNPDVDPYPFDTDEAERLIEESGFAGSKITLETPIGRYLKDVEVAQAAANQIDSLSNVSCELEQREFSALVQDITTGSIKDKPNFNLLGWVNGEFDGSQTITPLMTSDGALTIHKNDELDGLLLEAENAEDQDTRVEILQEANQLAHDLAPWVFLHQQFSVYGVSNEISWEPRSDEFIDPDTATQR